LKPHTSTITRYPRSAALRVCTSPRNARTAGVPLPEMFAVLAV
jgi:hypothetical protein